MLNLTLKEPGVRFWCLCLLVVSVLLLPASGGAAVEEANAGRGGEEMDLRGLLSQDRITVIEFSSPFCPPCMRIAPLMERLSASRRDLAIRKLNINRPQAQGIDWHSPLARQHHIRSVPYFMIFGPGGRLQAEGQAAAQQVERWLLEAGVIRN